MAEYQIDGDITKWELDKGEPKAVPVEPQSVDSKPEKARLTNKDVQELRQRLGISTEKSPLRPEVVAGYTVRLKYNSYGSVYITLNYDTITSKLIEIFITSSKTSARNQAYTNVLARMISNQIKHGIPLEQIYKHLIGIDEGEVSWVQYPGQTKSLPIKSVPDLIGNVLRFYPTYSDLESQVWENTAQELLSDDEYNLLQDILNGKDSEDDDEESIEVSATTESIEEKYDVEEGDASKLRVNSEDLVSTCVYGNAPDCPDAEWKVEAGCPTCLTCGWSKCG